MTKSIEAEWQQNTQSSHSMHTNNATYMDIKKEPKVNTSKNGEYKYKLTSFQPHLYTLSPTNYSTTSINLPEIITTITSVEEAPLSKTQ